MALVVLDGRWSGRSAGIITKAGIAGERARTRRRVLR